jgi:hypothetical protein
MNRTSAFVESFFQFARIEYGPPLWRVAEAGVLKVPHPAENPVAPLFYTPRQPAPKYSYLKQ